MHDLIILENMELEEVYIEHKQVPYCKNITPLYKHMPDKNVQTCLAR